MLTVFMTSFFTAILLAGGKSRRMGRDKAYLPSEWKGASVPLWERQLGVLRSVCPEKLVISGPHKQGYPASVAVLADEWTGVGPLGGIATCLTHAQGALLVLALDLPKIQPEFLRKLLARAEPGCGVVPVHQNRFEPLIAIYPRAAAGVALEQLEHQDYALQNFVRKLLEHRLMTGYEVDSSELHQLENWNTPEDAGLVP